MNLAFVTHSAGDANVRAAIERKHLEPMVDGVKITCMVAVASVYPGTWVATSAGSQAACSACARPPPS